MPEFLKHIQTAEASLLVKLNTIKKYNIVIDGKRTSVTLEPIIWEILHKIADEQKCDVHALCSFIHSRMDENGSLSSAIRVFLISYLFIFKQQKNG